MFKVSLRFRRIILIYLKKQNILDIFTSIFRNKNLNRGWNSVWWLTRVVSTVFWIGLGNDQPWFSTFICRANSNSSSFIYNVSIILGIRWRTHAVMACRWWRRGSFYCGYWNPPSRIVVDHSVVVIPKHISETSILSLSHGHFFDFQCSVIRYFWFLLND